MRGMHPKRDQAQQRLSRAQVATVCSTLVKIDRPQAEIHDPVEPTSGGLERLVRSSQLVAIHILLVGNDTRNSSIPPNERESEFF
jgi:hypothetical protein